MKTTTWPLESAISLSTALSRSSNSPRYFAPATMRADVERDQAPVAQRLGHVAVDDALGQALGDRRLAHAGLADQDGVVLRAAREDLDRAADLVVAADDRVELALLGRLGQVAPELLQRLHLVLGRLVGDLVRPADLVDARSTASPWSRRARAAAAPAAPSAPVRASSRCSTEMNSSPSSRISPSASRRTRTSASEAPVGSPPSPRVGRPPSAALGGARRPRAGSRACAGWRGPALLVGQQRQRAGAPARSAGSSPRWRGAGRPERPLGTWS